ncbi:MAG: rhodanese-like domain-containing protein [Ferrovum sp.]|nr:rhodanese-like domain-containing protein [Ferrovum sp.]
MTLNFVSQHLFQVALVFATGLLFLWPDISRLMGQYKEITPAAAVQLINHSHALVIDVRPANDFELGHIPKSVNIPLDHLLANGLGSHDAKERPVLLITTGQNPNRASSALKKIGVTEILILKGGISAWINDQLPIQKKPA